MTTAKSTRSTVKPTTAKGAVSTRKTATPVKASPKTTSATYMKGSVRFALEGKTDELWSYARFVSLASDSMNLPRLDTLVEVNHTFGLVYDYRFSTNSSSSPEYVWLVTNPLEKDPKKFKFMLEKLHPESRFSSYSEEHSKELLSKLKRTL